MKFAETYCLIASGHKTCTSRVPSWLWFDRWDYNGRANRDHSVVQAEGPNGEKAPIRLTGCAVYRLGYVRDRLYWEEGFSRPEEFESTWNTLYRGTAFEYSPDLLVCTIFFEKVKGR